MLETPYQTDGNRDKTGGLLNRKLSVAPMMGWTDRHCRYFHRLLAPQALLYTEMVTIQALTYGEVDRHLAFNVEEHPVALQLGGADPERMAKCAQLADARGYDEINMNVGCPSDRVQSGQFGACLMRQPKVVAECVAAMKAVTSLPVTVKTRIGVDDMDDYANLSHFTECVLSAGCDALIVHARKAWLQGLSPKENREIPPLNYEFVYRLKQDYPELTVSINGGICDESAVAQHLAHVDGVMLGRAAYQNPYVLARLQHRLYPGQSLPNRHQVVDALLPYIERQLSMGVHLKQISRHLLGLFAAQPGGRRWRRYLSEHAHKPGADVRVVEHAASLVPVRS